MKSYGVTAKTVGPALTFRKGLRDGLPICLGYLSVSFAYGMMAVEGGLPVWAAVLISMSNLTSSGQFAGTALIFAGGSFLEIGITTFVINIRYMLMSLSLSQKLDEKMSTLSRSILSFGNTDEIFAVAMPQRLPVRPDPPPVFRLGPGDLPGGRLHRIAARLGPQRPGNRHLRHVHRHYHPALPAVPADPHYCTSVHGGELPVCLYSGAEPAVRRLGHYHLRRAGGRLCRIPVPH